jgi:integrase
MTATLTAAAVRRMRPGKQRREVRDGGCRGLLLIIQPSGVKTWAMRFSQRGKLRRIALGPVDVSGKDSAGPPQLGQLLTLAAARRLALQLNHERASGHDVVAARHREKLERAARGAATFAVAAKDFITQHAQRHTRDWEEQARLLGFNPSDLTIIPKGLADRWRDEPISDINGDDIHGIVDEAREKGAPGLVRRSKRPTEARARAMMRTLSKMFGWLVAKRRLQANPCDGVARPQPPRARDRVLTNAEVVKFWRAAESMRKEFGVLLQLLLLTGCRLSEVAEMRRDELRDEGAGVMWVIPGTRTKNKREHIVPLPPMACELLASVPMTDGYVFTTDGAHPVSGWSKIKRRLDAAMKVPAWRLHDLRRTAATGMAGLGIAPHIVEAVLNHISGARAGVAGVYNRAAYAAEKKMALERWAGHVAGLVGGTPANVISLRRQVTP